MHPNYRNNPTNEDQFQKKFNEHCQKDLNYYGIIYSVITLIIGVMIAGTITQIYKIRAIPLDDRFNDNFIETKFDKEKNEKRKKEKEEKDKAKGSKTNKEDKDKGQCCQYSHS